LASEGENAEAVRRFWELFRAREWDEDGRKLEEGVVVDWPHTGSESAVARTSSS
jgi:hypothetical protein